MITPVAQWIRRTRARVDSRDSDAGGGAAAAAAAAVPTTNTTTNTTTTAAGGAGISRTALLSLGRETEEARAPVDVHAMRSRLERQHACFLSVLGVEYRYESLKVRLPGHRRYTPDFYLPTMDPPLILEIKPCYPYVEEYEKAVCASKQFPQAVVVILYGKLESAWARRSDDGTGPPQYRHSRGLKGIPLWKGERLAGEFYWSWDLARNRLSYTLETPHAAQYASVHHRRILDALRTAACAV